MSLLLLLLLVIGLSTELEALPSEAISLEAWVTLRSKFSHFETLRVEDTLQYVVSSDVGSGIGGKTVQFDAYKRKFHLLLTPSERLFADDFGAYCVGNEDDIEIINIDKASFAVGKLEGDRNSIVTAHISKSGVLSATISTSTETYFVEPSNRYLSYAHAFHMIVYRASDIIKPPMPNHDVKALWKPDLVYNRRMVSARTVNSGDVCSLLLVGDHTFYMAQQSNCYNAATYMIEVLNEANAITYQPASFVIGGESVTGIGLQAGKVFVRRTPSSVLYNSIEPNMSDEGYLDSFNNQDTNDLRLSGMKVHFSDYCLATAFSNRYLSGTLGIAYLDVACQNEFNTGLVTLNNHQLPQPCVRNVFSHEIGHNWGSEHDDQDSYDCTNHLMAPEKLYVQPEGTHVMLSSCSKQQIGEYLSLCGTCFKAKGPVTPPPIQPPTQPPTTWPPTTWPPTQPSTQLTTTQPSTQPSTTQPSTQPSTTQPSTQPPTTQPSTQPSTTTPGTCFGSECVYDSSKNCQCDAACMSYSDCCPDYYSVCAGSCLGTLCAYTSNQNCQCDAACEIYDDCCPDYYSVCAGQPPTQSPTQTPPTQAFDELRSYNHPDHYIGVKGDEAYIIKQSSPMKWAIVSPGLCGKSGTISIQSADKPTKYLRHMKFLLRVDEYTDTDSYRKDACFFLQKDKWFLGHDALESVNFPGRFIRHQGNHLKLHLCESTAIFEMDASFLVLSPTCSLFQSQNFPTYSFGLKGDAVYIMEGSVDRWVTVSPGLTGHPNTTSFRSCNDATKYLRHSNYDFWEHFYENSDLYRKEATFFQHKDKWFNGYSAYESINFPLHFIRHQNFRLRISPYDGSVPYKKDGSFHAIN